MVINRSSALSLGIILLLLAAGIYKQASLWNLSQSLIFSQRASYLLAEEEHFLFAWTPAVNNSLNQAGIEGASSERASEPTKHPETPPPARKASDDGAEPDDETVLSLEQANSNPGGDDDDNDRVEISLDDAAVESENKPYAALKMIEDAMANTIKLAKEKAYQTYSVPPPTPMLAESVPLAHFSHIHYVAIAGLGHRLVRHAAAVYIGRSLGFAVRGYWSKYNDFHNGTKDLFLELFDPFTRDGFAFVNSTKKTVRFVNGVHGMKGPAQHCSSSQQNGICQQRNTHGIECATCGCTNGEIQVHYDFYKSLRDEKYTRRDLVSAFRRNHKFSSHTVLGIHIRAGNGEKRDFTLKQRGIHHDPKEYVAALIQVIRNTIPVENLPKPPLIFLATDQPMYRIPVADEVQNQNLSWPVVVLEQDFAKSGVILYGHGKYKEKWHSMFQDMVLLSYSDVLIATQYSSFVQSMPMSLVLGRPESERTVQDGYCEVIDENDDGSKEGMGPMLQLYCYHSYMQNCCGTTNKVHRKVTKFLNPRYRGQPINATIEDFYPRQYFSFEDSLGRFVWNVSR
ncbi:MAG: hypothetical protein SGBAC_005517 [Bacillariaceae sp.]